MIRFNESCLDNKIDSTKTESPTCFCGPHSMSCMKSFWHLPNYAGCIHLNSGMKLIKSPTFMKKGLEFIYVDSRKRLCSDILHKLLGLRSIGAIVIHCSIWLNAATPIPFSILNTRDENVEMYLQLFFTPYAAKFDLNYPFCIQTTKWIW